MKHITPIITRARLGEPLSTLNRRRRASLWPLILAGAAFWIILTIITFC